MPSPVTQPVFRRATGDDVPHIVRVLADDLLGAKRERYETPLPTSHDEAFAAIDADPNNELVVASHEGVKLPLQGSPDAWRP